MADPLDFTTEGLTPDQLSAVRNYQAARGAAAGAADTGFVGPQTVFTQAPPAGVTGPQIPPGGLGWAARFGRFLKGSPIGAPGALAATGAIAGVGLQALTQPTKNAFLDDPNVSWGQKALVTTRDALANAGGALGAIGGAGVGGAAVPVVGAPIGAIGGGIGGYKAGDWLGQKIENLVGGDPLANYKAPQYVEATPVAPGVTPAPAPVAPAPVAPASAATVNISSEPNGIPVFTSGIPASQVPTGAYTGKGMPGGTVNIVPSSAITSVSPAVSAELSAARQAAWDRGDHQAVLDSFSNPAQTPEAAAMARLNSLPINSGGDLKRYSAIATALGASLQRQNEAEHNAAAMGALQSKNAFDQAVAMADLGIKQQNANTEAAKSSTAKVTMDAYGNPLIVDTKTGTMVKPTTVPSVTDYITKVRAEPGGGKFTDDELKAAYKARFGSK